MAEVIIPVLGAPTYPGPTALTDNVGAPMMERGPSAIVGSGAIWADDSDATYAELTSTADRNSNAFVTAPVQATTLATEGVRYFYAEFRVAASALYAFADFRTLYDGAMATASWGEQFAVGDSTGEYVYGSPGWVGVGADLTIQPAAVDRVNQWIGVLNAGRAWMGYSVAGASGAGITARVYEARIRVGYPDAGWMPPLRQVQRGDGLGSSVPRAVQNNSRQASLRSGRAFI